MCAAHATAPANTRRSPEWRWNAVRDRNESNKRPAIETTTDSQAAAGIRCPNTSEARMGVNTTYRVVMKAALVAVVRTSPSVCRMYPAKMSAPSNAPAQRAVSRRLDSRGPAEDFGSLRRSTGNRIRMVTKPNVRVHAMKAKAGRCRRAILEAGKAAPHRSGVRRIRSPASTRRRTGRR